MFGNPVKPSEYYEEGTVLSIDSQRKVCKVRTLWGRNLLNVQYGGPGGSSRYGDSVDPCIGDRVVISHVLGFPYISAYLPAIRPESPVAPNSTIDSNSTTIDTGNFTGNNSITTRGSAPPDAVTGDRIIASSGGGMFALLRGGSLLLRSSRLAQVFLSKWGDLVRIVSRNFEHYTDVGSNVCRNVKGAVFRYAGYTHLFSGSANEDYQYHNYFGNVAAAEAIKAGQSTPGAIPSSTTLFKEQVTSGGSEVMRRTLDLSGNEEVYISGGGTFFRIKTSGGEMTLSFHDQNTVTINTEKIECSHSSGAVVRMDTSKTLARFGNNTVIINSAGIAMSGAGGESNMSSSGIEHKFGGHGVRITGTGVELY